MCIDGRAPTEASPGEQGKGTLKNHRVSDIKQRVEEKYVVSDMKQNGQAPVRLVTVTGLSGNDTKTPMNSI